MFPELFLRGRSSAVMNNSINVIKHLKKHMREGYIDTKRAIRNRFQMCFQDRIFPVDRIVCFSYIYLAEFKYIPAS